MELLFIHASHDTNEILVRDLHIVEYKSKDFGDRGKYITVLVYLWISLQKEALSSWKIIKAI